MARRWRAGACRDRRARAELWIKRGDRDGGRGLLVGGRILIDRRLLVRQTGRRGDDGGPGGSSGHAQVVMPGARDAHDLGAIGAALVIAEERLANGRVFLAPDQYLRNAEREH